MKRLTTRSRATAEAIRDREDFVTSGSLRGITVMQPNRLGRWDSGQLAGTDLAWFYNDLPTIDYVVWSYSTPIAWWSEEFGWHRVGQTFSVTTSKHQSNLYLIDRENHEVAPLIQSGSTDPTERWQVLCHTCNQVIGGAQYKADAARLAHTHRIAGRLGVMPT